MRILASMLALLLAAPAHAAEKVAPSCDGGPGAGNDCQGQSCCTRNRVPGGSFLWATAPGAAPERTVVSTFHLDRYEATVGRFKAWARAGSPLPEEGTVLQRDLEGNPIVWTAHARRAAQRGARLAGWRRYDTWTAERFTAPKNNLNWYTAAAFCHWDGGRLPTEVEWQYAAVGGDELRRHPWGDASPTLEHAVFNCGGDGGGECSLDDLLPVGSKPKGAGRWGHRDLAGSVFEWTVRPRHRADGGRSHGGGFCYIGGIDHRAPPGLDARTARFDKLETISHTVGVRCAYDRPLAIRREGGS